MLLLDAALRISAITLMLMCALLALRDARHLLQAKLLAATAVSLSAMLIQTMPEAMQLPDALGEVFWVLHMPNTVLIWLFGLSLFEDDFRLRPIHWAVLAAILTFMCLIRLSMLINSNELLYLAVLANRIVGFGVLSHLIWTALSGRSNDLVESRRQTRLWFVMGIAVTAVLIISGETAHFLYSGTGEDPDWLSTLRTAFIWPMVFLGTIWFLNLRPESFLFETAPASQTRVPQIDPKDLATHQRLTSIMNEGAYSEAGLTIGKLAEKIGVPEHQLRALINQGLGFRNFAAFLNSYRIDYAKQILSDPEQARLPILTIAMDAGYNSLAPFNRAFKASVGVTPSQYRRTALSTPDQS